MGGNSHLPNDCRIFPFLCTKHTGVSYFSSPRRHGQRSPFIFFYFSFDVCFNRYMYLISMYFSLCVSSSDLSAFIQFMYCMIVCYVDIIQLIKHLFAKPNLLSIISIPMLPTLNNVVQKIK